VRGNSIQTKLKPCLGSDCVLPFWLTLDGKYCPNQLVYGVATTWFSRQGSSETGPAFTD
jgi:hypothetical protein